MQDINKEFKPSSWAINNKVAVFVLTLLLAIAGTNAYISLPKESFPDISLPNIYVSVIYPGTSPKDMENLIVRPIEKECKNIAGVKKIKSSSLQDYCNVVVEFNSDVNIEDAKQKVKDAVDKAKKDLPKDLKNDPEIIEINFSDLPVMQVNKVEIIGALEREIQINVDMIKMQAANLTMGDIQRAVQSENLTFPGGSVRMDGISRSLSVTGEFKNTDQIGNLVINSINGKPVYLKDIARVIDSFHEQQSYARLDHNNVITLNIIKRKGENLIESSDKIVALMDDIRKNDWPKDVKVVLTGDQSEQTRTTLHDLINTIIIGFVLVFGDNQCVLCRLIGTTFDVSRIPCHAGARIFIKHDCAV